MNVTPDRLAAKLTDPKLTAALSHFVRTRVPEADAEDIVQSTIADALDAQQHPEQDEEIVRWVHGICRHKLIDWFRRAKREVPRDLEASDTVAGAAPLAAAADSAPISAMDLLRWAKKELPEGEEHAKTLEWMLREGEGEKLETIAAEANLPAPRVRQRVSRLRRWYKARWAAQSAALAALLLVALAIVLALRKKPEQVAPAPGPTFAPSEMPSMAPTAPEPPPPERPATSTEPAPTEPPAPTKPESTVNASKKNALPRPVSTEPSAPFAAPTSSAAPPSSAAPAPAPAKKAPAKPRPTKAGDSIGGFDSK